MPPRAIAKSRHRNGQKPVESKSAARRDQGLGPEKKPDKKIGKFTVPRPPVIFTDIPAVTRELDEQSQRYSYKVDHDALAMLASTHASYEHLAQVLNVPEATLYEDEHKAIIEQARAEALVTLRAAQFKLAVEGMNPAMQIWLGKQLLGQKDLVQSQQLGADGRPINGFHGPTFVAVMPTNGRDLSQSRLAEGAKALKAAEAELTAPIETKE